MWPSGASQCKGHILNALGNMHAAEIGMYNQTRGCHVLLLLPRLDVAEPCKASVLGQRYDSLGLHHLLGQILVCTFGNTRASYFSSLGNGVEYGVNILLVLGACH